MLSEKKYKKICDKIIKNGSYLLYEELKAINLKHSIIFSTDGKVYIDPHRFQALSDDLNNLFESHNLYHKDFIIVLETDNSTISKKEIADQLTFHSVFGYEYKEHDITDKASDLFNLLYSDFIQKYPGFDWRVDDYEGESDDEYINILMQISDLINKPLA